MGFFFLQSPLTSPASAVFLFYIKMFCFIMCFPALEPLESCGIRGFLWNSPNFVLGDVRIIINRTISESPFVYSGY